MASQYFAILTDYGTRAIAHALSQGQPLQLTQFAVGDGNGKAVTPTASAIALVHQTHIAPVSAVSLDPRNNKQVIVELTIPENIGGFYIREMGVFDAQNKLIAYANCPESFKPAENSGSGKVQVLRMILKVESSSAVTLSIDNSVIFVTRQQMAPKTITATTQNGFDESGHSHEIAKASTTQQGIVQLTNDTGLESESLALTAKAGKKLAQQTTQLQLNVSQNYIENSKKSSAVNSESEDNVATSKAAKTAYDKAVEAKTTAESKVGLRGNESIQGTKSFESKIIGFRGIGVADSQTYANANHLLNMGANDGDGWIEYKKINRAIGTIRIRANGELSYNNQKIYHAGEKPQFNTDIEGKPNTLAGYGIGNFKVEQGQGDANGYKTDGNYYLASGQNLPENGAWHIEVVSGGATNAVRQIARKANDNKIKTRFFNGSNWSEWKETGGDGVPLGAIVSFPRAVTNPVGFLRADGSTFSQQTFPDLYRTLGNSNQLPDLTRSDVGMTAYFAVDNIPNGWIAFDSIRTTVTQQNYPELYRHLVGKYGSLSNVPLAEDRFIRNTGNGLNIGQTQSDEIKKHVHRVRTHWADSSDSSIFYDKTKTVIDSRLRTATTTDDNLSDNGFMHPLLDSPMATGGAETRPRAIALKLCIKAKNTFDDVQFWVKAFGVVENVGALDAGTLAQNMQALSARVDQEIEENKQYTLREINNAKSDINQQFLQAKESLSQISTLKTVWQGNVSSGSINISEKCFGKTLILYLQSSSGHSLDDNNNIELVSFEVGAEIEGKRGGGVYFSSIRQVIPHNSGGTRVYYVEVKKFAVTVDRNGTTINIVDLSGYFVKRIDIR
ncbi:TPA: phage tail protein [Haemophilus influenzae]|uniref:phage tail-collar fiber domain-containing protein n=1 Tax=Haemophilus influenzae TaxID=727 RepID=UPI0001A3F4C5|nr:phage tail protein [Haemophilus influenzae]AKA47546.1 tail fiber protein [Haemophilus influenzae 2019]EEP47441.1 probable tail fiber protein [Haemophilus influenzae 6P18H1]KKZ22014.1 tail fiber protein [Haemophilus influenzae 2019]MCK9113043.1 phage tail protein [Haemophilus influenzae]PRJ77305.1 phage tail fiber repeat protein [Haemophilus influenzae]